ncbi:MAG TPA: hypothetical protein VF294_18990 [Polyangiaceae bacterium]
MPPTYLAIKMIHFVGLALGVGATFAALTLRRASAGLEPAEREKFLLRTMVLSKNGSYGLLVLLLSGLGMFFMRGPGAVMAAGGPALHAKLTLVLVLCGLVGYGQALGKRAREAGGGPLLAKLHSVRLATLATALAIIVAAVIAFQ